MRGIFTSIGTACGGGVSLFRVVAGSRFVNGGLAFLMSLLRNYFSLSL